MPPHLHLPFSVAERPPGGWLRSLFIAVLLVSAATLLRFVLDPWLAARAPYFAHIAAVAAATWLGGAQAGVVAAILGVFAVEHLLIAPRAAFTPLAVHDPAALSVFVAVALALVWQVGRWHRAERQLRVSERRLRHLVEVSSQIVWVADAKGLPLEDSPSWAAFTGRRFDRSIGWDWLECLHPDDRERVSEEWRRAVAEVGPYAPEYRMRHHTGEYRDILSRAVPILDEGGQVLEWIGMSTDITDRTHAEAERARARSRLTLLLETSEALSAAATPDEIVTIVLERAVPALGAHAGSVALLPAAGDEIEILGSWGYPSPRRIPLTSPSPLSDAIREGRTITVTSPAEWEQRYPDVSPDTLGTPGHALAAIPIRSTRIVGALGLSFASGQDLDARDRAFAALLARQTGQALDRANLLISERLSHAQAEEAGRVKDEFLATLSHELRTPLNAILGWSQLLAAGTLNPDSQRRAIEVIARNAKVQTRLVEEVLDISRIVTGRLRLELQPVDLQSVVERAIDTTRPAAEAKAVQIDVQYSGDMATMGDAGRLQQVLWNLLANAVKFTPEGGRVTVSARRLDSRIEIEVTDTGVGMEPHLLPRVFDRFTQADSSRTRQYGGLGLGLAIVRHIVEAHGGTVAARSAGPGTGSSFTVTLPVGPVCQAEAPAAPEPDETRPSPTLPSLAGVRVLAVDDDADSREVLERILTGHGATVVVAGSARDGMEVLRHLQPDVLISDIAMPEEDGLQFIARIRRLEGPEARVPAVALTAYGHHGDRANALAAGYDQHVAKPVTPRDLVAVVACLVRRTSAAGRWPPGEIRLGSG